MADEQKPFRVMVFPERPDAILLVVPDGCAASLPAVRAPFNKHDVAALFAKAGIAVRVVEEAPGRWSAATLRARRDAYTERRSVNLLRERTTAALSAQSEDPIMRDRGALMARKIEVDTEMVSLKSKVGKAKSDAFTRRVYMDPTAFRALERRLESAKVESQSIQAQLGKLNKADRARERVASEAEARSFERRFVDAAKALLEPDDFQDIVDTANDEADAAAE